MTGTRDIVVIGGGVIGMACAWRLRQAGLQVTLVERGECGRQASWAAVGVLSPGNPNFKHALATLHLDCLDAYPGFCSELHEVTGIDPEYRRCGRLEFCDDDQRYRMGLSEVRAASDRRMPNGRPVLEMLEPQQAVELEPVIRPPLRGALHCRLSAQVRNPRLLRALRSACDTWGAEVREHCWATGLVWDGDRVAGVQTEEGTLAAGWVVLAAGAWSGQMDARLAGLIDVHPVRGQAVLLESPDTRFDRIVRRRKRYALQRRDGKVLIGATEEPESGFALHNTPVDVGALLEAGMDLIPALARARVIGMWSGLRPGTPDNRPYIGFVPGADGLIAACGHFKTGLVFAPATARIVAELVTKGATTVDLARAAPGRPMRSSKVRRS
jgi:glycine oxidase